MRNIYALVAAFLIAAISFAVSASAEPVDPQQVEREVLFMLAPNAADLDGIGTNVPLDLVPMPAGIRAVLLEQGVAVVSRAIPDFTKADTLSITPDGRSVRFSDWTNYLVAQMPATFHPDTLVARLERLDEVLWANRNQMLIYSVEEAPSRAQFYCPPNSGRPIGEIIPTDAFFTCQWALKNTGAPHQGSGTPGADIRATYAWPYTTGSHFIKLGIIDHGIDGNHVDFSGRVFGHTSDDTGHGTHVAGIAAASANNPGGGIAGVDWHTSIHSRAAFTALQATQALIDLVQAGAHVINNSWVVHQFDQGLYTAFRNAFANGRVLVTAATPDYALPGPYPSGFGPWILNVTAVNNEGERAHYTIPAPHVDVAAPGGEGEWYTGKPGTGILSTLPNNNWGYASGTSMAAPHVSGAATLMLAAEPNQLRNFDIEHILKRSAEDWPNHSDEVGYGLIEVAAALERLQPPYTITHGQAQFNQFLSNGQRNFLVSPAPGIAAGSYNVDGYEFVASASFSYEETPWAWLSLTDKGFSYANPNNAERWMSETVNPTEMELKTVFYFIRSNLQGQQINRWVPFDPTIFPTMYTVLGKPGTPPPPVDVYITGSTLMNDGEEGTWTAHASGGTGSYSYTWTYRYSGSFSWQPIENTAGDTAWQRLFCSEGTGATIRVVAHSGGVQGDAEHNVGLLCQGLLAGDGLPETFSLAANYPNPFGDTAQIAFGLPENAHVTLTVYDVLGREVARLVDGRLDAGFHSVALDAGSWTSGVYVYRMEATGTRSGEHFTKTRQMTVAQ